MENWLDTLLEIIKVTLPALVVFFTVYYLFKQYLQKELAVKRLDYKHNKQSTTIPMRLQAYERLSLFLERIGIPGMMLRVKEENTTANQLKLGLMVAIQREFEHNITQQVYVSDQLWKIISAARQDVMASINTVYEQMPAQSSADEYANALIKFVSERDGDPLAMAQSAIKKEAGVILA